MIAWYNGDNVADAQPLPAVWSSILVKRLRVQGFLFPDHQADAGQFFEEVAPMVVSGQVKFRETVTEGLQNAPKAFLELLEGKNFGKQLVRVGDDP
jgi:NADPH-dependent curcumin reductase CurA